MSRLFKSALAVLCALAVTGCSTNSTAAATSAATEAASTTDTATASASTENEINGKKYSDMTIGYSVQTLSNQYFVTVSDGFKKYADELGIKTIVTDGKQDANAQVSQVEDFIAQKVDAIVISPVNDKALEDVVKQAEDAGITVVAANQDFPGSQAFVTIPEYDMGRALGDQTGKWLKDKYGDNEVQVLVLDYPEIESIIARGDGIREGITENDPKAVIVQSISANTPEKGSAAMETAFQKYPDIKAVAGVNDAGVLGAYEVVMASGKDLTNFYMGGIDATDQSLKLIKDDSIYRTTIDINPKGTGKIIIDTVLDVMKNGAKTDPVTIDLNTVTIDNVDEFLK